MEGRNLTPSDLAKLRTKLRVSDAVIRRSLCVSEPAPGCQVGVVTSSSTSPSANRDNLPAAKTPKPLMNKTEMRFKAILKARGITEILDQSITLRLDPPFKSYRPDLAYLSANGLCFVEVKGPHRFRRAGIAKAALAALTYPQFRFLLADWTGKEWKETRLCP